MEVKEGELIEVPVRVKMWKQTPMASVTSSVTPPNDKESDDDTAETVFVPETPAAETDDQ